MSRTEQVVNCTDILELGAMSCLRWIQSTDLLFCGCRVPFAEYAHEAATNAAVARV